VNHTHRTKFWWSCPACLTEKQHETTQQILDLTAQLVDLQRAADWTNQQLAKLKEHT